MPDTPKIQNGWSEYAHTILSKIEELHKDNKQTQKDIAEIKLAIVKLEINKDEVNSLREWKKEVCEVWSTKNMDSAHREIYIQKGKWSTVWGVMIAVNIIWGIVLAYLKLK